MGSCKNFFVVSVLLFSLVAVSVPLVSAVSDDAVSLEVAEEALVLAYDSVLEAEEAGANVTSLFERLNLGGRYLAEAYASIRLGDSDNADRLAGLCVEAVDDVQRDAVLLREKAIRSEREDLLVRVFSSSVGVVIVLVSGFVLWDFIKRRNYTKVLDSKPEVNDGEA